MPSGLQTANAAIDDSKDYIFYKKQPLLLQA